MEFDYISAVILAAGESRRMGQPKLLLPWGETTILGQVISSFSKAGVGDIVVVTGGARDLVEGLVLEQAAKFPVRTTFNPDHQLGEMLSSIKAGLKVLSHGTRAALIALGDQPQVRADTIKLICNAFLETDIPLIIPSFENQRGHPWLAAAVFWDEIMALPVSTTPRDFLNVHAGAIKYIVTNKSILEDVDTPADYSRLRP